MILDCHSHVMRYPEHISDELQKDLVSIWEKLDPHMASGGAAEPSQHWQAIDQMDKAIVLALWAPQVGFRIPNDYVAEYVHQHPDKLIGFMSVHPHDPDALSEIKRCFNELGLKGLKLGPVYQHFDPESKKAYPIYDLAQQLKLPIMWHQGIAGMQPGALKYGYASKLDQVARDFPDLTMIIAHLGMPWYWETVAMVFKHPNVYTDMSSCYATPWQFYQAMLMCHEMGVLHKVLFGSDYPFGTPQASLNALKGINNLPRNANLPTLPEDKITDIIEKNALAALKGIL